MEKEKEKKDGSREQQHQKGKENVQAQRMENEKKRKQNNNDQGKQKQIEQQREEECHTQRRRNYNTQEDKNNKTTWKQVHTPNQPANEQMQNPSQQTVILNNIQCSSFNNWSMQEPHIESGGASGQEQENPTGKHKQKQYEHRSICS